MSRGWKQLVDAMTEDDLFIRVILAIFGLGSAALGLQATCAAIRATYPWGGLLVCWVMGAVFLSWGILLFGAAFAPPASRWSKLAEKFYPNPSGLDDAAIVLVIVLIPAAAFTILLRACGLRGHDC
jgi:hypothetical protein